MRKNIVALGILFVTILFAQGPDTLWTRTYGGSNHECGYSVQQTSDAGYIVLGQVFSPVTFYDAWLIKTDSIGDTLWTKMYGGSDWDYVWSILQSVDQGYIITGTTRSFGAGNYDVWLIKTNSIGDTLWTKTYGGVNYDASWSIEQTTDGGYIIAGATESFGAGGSDVWLLKTNANGDTSWTRTYGGADDDYGYSAQQTSDGGYILTGWTYSFGAGGSDVWLIKTNANGDTSWTRTYGGTNPDEGRSIEQTTDGGYIIAGATESFGAGGSDVWLIKTNANGDTLWTRTYGGAYDDNAHSVRKTSDGGCVTAGMITTSPGLNDVYFIRTDATGDTVWTMTYGEGNTNDGAYSFQKTTDGSYIIIGGTRLPPGLSNVYLIKTAADTFSIEEEKVTLIKNNNFKTTIINGPLLLPEDKNCKIFDIMGRIVVPDKIKAGIYFVEIDGQITRKVVKIR